MAKREPCRSCGAKNMKPLCVVCMRQLPSDLQKRAFDAMRHRFATVEDLNWFSLVLAWLEDENAFWKRIMGSVKDDTTANI